MAQLVKHLKQSIIADGPDPNQVNPSDWNASHVFSGGALGSLLMRDTGDATYGASWIATVAAGGLLISNGVGAVPSWLASAAAGGLLISTGVGAVPSWLASVATGSVLVSNGIGALPTWTASLTLGGSLTVGGLLTATGFGTHILSGSGIGANVLRLQNSLAGATNMAEFDFGNDVSTASGVIVACSSTYTPNLYLKPNGIGLIANGAGGLNLSAASAPITFWTTNAERMRIQNDGSVLINATASGFSPQLAITTDMSTHNAVVILNVSAGNSGFFELFLNSAGGTAGTIAHSGATSVQYNTTSDARLKDDHGRATDLLALRAVVVHDFTWKADGIRDRGVFAQDTHALYPRAVSPGDDDTTESGALAHPWMTDYSKFVPDLIVGWQQHEATIAALRAELLALKGQN